MSKKSQSEILQEKLNRLNSPKKHKNSANNSANHQSVPHYQAIKNTANEYCREDNAYAQKILHKISQQWDTGKQTISYYIKVPKTKSQCKKDYLLFFAGLMGAIVVFILSAAIVGKLTAPVATVFSISVAILYHTKFGRYIKRVVIIKRNKREVIYCPIPYLQRQVFRYGQANMVLPMFRLPENDNGFYRQMRQQLQQKISAETGCLFDESV